MPTMTIAEALREGIREEMRRDPTVFCLGEDIGVPGGFGGVGRPCLSRVPVLNWWYLVYQDTEYQGGRGAGSQGATGV